MRLLRFVFFTSLVSLCLALSGCGYHFPSESSIAPLTLYVPYVKGDYEGRLTSELTARLSDAGALVLSQAHARYVLDVEVIRSEEENIGYEYDHATFSSVLKKRLLANENRKTLFAKVSLKDSRTGELLFGPEIVSAYGEYDYINGDSASFLSFVDLAGNLVPVLQYSLGQLDSIEGADVDVLTPIYRVLSQKIATGLGHALLDSIY